MEDEHKDSVDDRKTSREDEHIRNGSAAANDQKPAYDEEDGRRKSRNLKEDPFGDETDNEVKYRTMHWWQAAITMIAETISLGILSLPSVLATVGMVGGLITLLGLGIVATYTGYVLGQFKMAYPHIHNMADAGEVLFEPIGMAAIGREVFGTAQCIFLVFIMASHVLTWIIAFNALTGHVTCSIVWGVVGLVVLFICTLPRTLKKVSYLSISCMTSAVFTNEFLLINLSIHLHLCRRNDHHDWHRHRKTRSTCTSNNNDELSNGLWQHHKHYLRIRWACRILQLHF
jgi:hypothetical protein